MTIYRVLLDSIDDFFELDFLNETGLITTICADPARADSLSLLLNENRMQPLTIAQFVKETIKKFSPESTIYRKSELYLELSVIWKKAGGEPLFNLFDQAFTLFTDYRGYTGDISLIDEILSEHPEQLAQALKWFYAYLEIQQILDEQAAYKKCGELIEQNDCHYNSVFFLGFNHFSAMQLELLNSLSKKADIYIPSFRENEESLLSTDWAYWLDSMGAEKIDLPSRKLDIHAEVQTYPKGYLSEVLKKRSSEFDQVLLFQKNPDIKEFVEADLFQGFFKVQTDLFEMYISEVERADWSEENILDKIKLYTAEKDFIRLKLYLALIDTIQTWKEISDENNEIEDFDKKIILEILKLNLPRISNLPVGEAEWGHSIVDLSQVETLDTSKKVAICVKNNGLSFSSSSEAFNEKVKEFLVALGPIRNIKRERKQLQSHIKTLLNRENIAFFLEEGTTEENLFWNELNLDQTKKVVVDTQNQKKDFLKEKITRTELEVLRPSASRLQTFIDCPRKYYFTYLDKMKINKVFKTKFSSSEMGIIVHEIIERKITNENMPLTEIIQETMAKFSVNKKVSPINWETSRLKLEYRSKNAIGFLSDLRKLDPSIKFEFEKSLSGDNVSGQIDCLWRSDIIGNGIIDFKSSIYGIPSKIEHQDFRKIQLWFYLNHMDIPHDKINFWGFLNLEDVNKSLFYSSHESSILGIKSNIDSELNLEGFQNYLQELYAQIKNEKIFAARPAGPSVCSFCDLSNLCPREDIHGQ